MKRLIKILASSTLSVVISSTMVSGAIASSQATVTFSDLKGQWSENVVKQGVTKGYVSGYPDGAFKPDRNISRIEFLKMIVVAKFGAQSETGANWYDTYLSLAKTKNIIKEEDFPDGDWNKPMTRFELARIASRAIGQDTDDFKKWMYIATSNGLMQGLDDRGTIGEDLTTNRAQSVVIIERVLGILHGQKQEVSQQSTSQAEIEWHNTNVFSMLPHLFLPEFQKNFDMSKARWNAPDGNYTEALERMVVVDMADPNDPNRDLVHDMMFRFPTYNAQGKETGWEGHEPAKDTYVIVSVVKQHLNSRYSIKYGSSAGYVSFSQLGPVSDTKEWKSYQSQHTPSNPIFSAAMDKYIDWNNKYGANNYDPTNFEPGKDYYWYTGYMIPKSAGYGGTSMLLRFAPNYSYAKEIGATAPDVTFFFGNTAEK